jgi:hypothetical protein
MVVPFNFTWFDLNAFRSIFRFIASSEQKVELANPAPGLPPGTPPPKMLVCVDGSNPDMYILSG